MENLITETKSLFNRFFSDKIEDRTEKFIKKYESAIDEYNLDKTGLNGVSKMADIGKASTIVGAVTLFGTMAALSAAVISAPMFVAAIGVAGVSIVGGMGAAVLGTFLKNSILNTMKENEAKIEKVQEQFKDLNISPEQLKELRTSIDKQDFNAYTEVKKSIHNKQTI